MPASYLRYPHLHGDTLVFVAEDDVWTAPVGGGRAYRLTADDVPVARPRLSPDGTRVAWTSWREKAPEVFVTAIDGGGTRRLTWWGDHTTRLIGWTPEGKWEARDFAGQFRQALLNILAVLKEANGKPEHIVRLTWYVLDKHEYLNSVKSVGEAYRELMGRHYPTMAVVQVGGLVEDEARLEIEATAVVP